MCVCALKKRIEISEPSESSRVLIKVLLFSYMNLTVYRCIFLSRTILHSLYSRYNNKLIIETKILSTLNIMCLKNVHVLCSLKQQLTKICRQNTQYIIFNHFQFSLKNGVRTLTGF